MVGQNIAPGRLVEETDPRAREDVVLRVEGVSKVYPGTRALDNVSLELRRGEIRGLCGGNGCGKSTLIKILSGVVAGDAGVITMNSTATSVTDMGPQRARELGINVVHQDLAVFPDLSVMENMMLGADFPTQLGRVNWREGRRRANTQIDRFQIPAAPNTLLRDLPVATRTQVAIARALQDVSPDQPSVLILDEPTASLPAHEVELLLDAVRLLAAEGHAVVFVSHRLDEVLALTSTITVMRDGRVVAQHDTAELTESELIEAILGRRAAEVAVKRGKGVIGDPVLTVTDLDAGPLQGVSFEVRSGEVVGIAGLLGSGRTELLRSICGDMKRNSGSIVLDGHPVDFTSLTQAIDAGVILIPEDRAKGAAFPDLSVNDNLDISVLNRSWRPYGFPRKAMRAAASSLRSAFKVKSASGDIEMKSLSGGNQQKTIIARWFRLNPSVLLLDEPTQGVDVGARADIYAAVRRATDDGGAAVVVTSDLEELAMVVDRAIVLHQGRIVAEVTGSELNAQRLNELIYVKNEEGRTQNV